MVFPYFVGRAIQVQSEISLGPDLRVHSDNFLDIQLFKSLIQDVHSSSLALMFGMGMPWLPYLYFAGIVKTIKGGLDPFYSHVKHSHYSASTSNPNSQWHFILNLFTDGDTSVEVFEMPLLAHMCFILTSNLLIFVIVEKFKTRTYNDSNKSQILTIFLLFSFNFFLGNPKLQSVSGNLMIMIVL